MATTNGDSMDEYEDTEVMAVGELLALLEACILEGEE